MVAKPLCPLYKYIIKSLDRAYYPELRYKYKAYEWGNTRKGYWRIADSPILKRAIDNNKLRSAGYATLMEAYLEWYPK